MESLVKLTVKTPNQGFDDIQINCDLDWTVRKLKEYLQDVYPSKPSSSSQRLIYLGRLLQDHLSLKEVFGEWGARTLHIVCSEPTEAVAAPTMSTSTTTATTTTNSAQLAANTQGMDGLRFRGIPSSQEMPSQQPFMGGQTMPSMFPQFMPAVSSTQPQYTQYQQMQSQLVQQYQLQMQQYYQQMYQWQQGMGANQWAAMGGDHLGTNQFAPNMFYTPPNAAFSMPPGPSTSAQPTHPNTPFGTSPGPNLSPQPTDPAPQQAQEEQQPQPEVVPNQGNRCSNECWARRGCPTRRRR